MQNPHLGFPRSKSYFERTWLFLLYHIASHSLMTLKEKIVVKSLRMHFNTSLVAMINTYCQLGLYLAACNRNPITVDWPKRGLFFSVNRVRWPRACATALANTQGPRLILAFCSYILSIWLLSLCLQDGCLIFMHQVCTPGRKKGKG